MAWKERCGARRRDGKPCGAPTIPYGFVCRRHGGSAPQVQLAAGRRRLQERYIDAVFAWEDARGTNRDFEFLCKVATAERELERFEAKLAEVSRLRSSLAARRPTVKAEGVPARPADVASLSSGEPTGAPATEPRSESTAEAAEVLSPTEILFGPADVGEHGTTRPSPFT